MLSTKHDPTSNNGSIGSPMLYGSIVCPFMLRIPLLWWRRGRVELPVQRTPHWNLLQACPVLFFSPPGSLLARSFGSQPIILKPQLSASTRAAPRFMSPSLCPRGKAKTDVVTLFRRPGRVVFRQLLFRRLFTRLTAPRPAIP